MSVGIRTGARGARSTAAAVLLAGLLAAVAGPGGLRTVAAAEAADAIAMLPVGAEQATIGGKTVDLGFATHVIDGVVWAPVRAIGEALGGRVAWDGQSRTTTVTLGHSTVAFTVGSTTARVHGNPVMLSTAVHILNNRTQVPVQVLAEGLGYGYGFDAATNTAYLKAPGHPAGMPDPGTGTGETGQTGGTGGAAAARTHTVDIQGFAFSAAVLTVNVGDTVVWTNRDGAPHTVTGSGLGSGLLDPGAAYRYTFTQPGVYEYHCEFHPTMTARIVVQAAGTSTGATGATGGGGSGPTGGGAAAAATIQVANHPDLGPILTDSTGRTLYIFTRDTAGVSNCSGPCAERWPALTVSAGQPTAAAAATGRIGVIERADGGRQVTYDGMPLYYFANDTAPGDARGQGVNNIWYVVRADRPSGAASPATVQVSTHPDLGPILTDSTGRTLYTFSRDTEGVSNCSGQCAQRWPALTVSAGQPTGWAGVNGKLGVIDRADGGRQVTYDGKPLYYFADDKAAGEAKGQGVGEVWFVVKLTP